MTNAAYDIETIYSPAGEPHKCTRLNAIDLVRTAGFTWKPSAEVAEKIVAEAVEETLAAEPAAPEPEAPAAEAEEELINAATADLEEVSAALAGTDPASYLNGFSTEALRTIAEERYGERLRSNISKEKAVERILALEATRIENESGFDS